jgi:hypothetical protein
MTTGNKKKLYERPWLIFVITFLGLILLLSLFALVDATNFPSSIGLYYLGGGIVAGAIAFAFINKGKGSRGGWLQSKQILHK